MSSPTIPQLFHNDSGQVVPQSHISIDVGIWDSPQSGTPNPESPGTISGHTGPVLPSHPLDAQGVMRICLNEAASSALAALGPHLLVIATPADATVPESMKGRYILHAMPCTPERLNDAHRICRGEKPKARIRSKA